MEDKSTAYWDGWLSESFDISNDQNPYSPRLQASSHRQWNAGYWDRYDADNTEDSDINIEKYDWFALNGERY